MNQVNNAGNPFLSSCNCPKCNVAMQPRTVYGEESVQIYIFSCDCGAISLLTVAPLIEALQIPQPPHGGQVAGIVLTQKKSAILVPQLSMRPGKRPS